MMSLKRMVNGLFRKKSKIILGNVETIDVCDFKGNVIFKINYTMPTSDLITSYIYDSQFSLDDESDLKDIAKLSRKESMKKMHDILMDDVFIPYAKEIFQSVDGELYSGSGEKISEMDKGEQFAYMKKYYSHCLGDMVAIAFKVDSMVKKN